MKYLVANEARKSLYKLIDQAAESHEPTIIKGKRNSAVLISSKDWDDIQETLFVANNRELSQSILEGLSSTFADCSTMLEDN